MGAIKKISFGIILLLYSCVKVEPTQIEFQGHSFELPGKVSDLQKSLNLKYSYYSGFYKGGGNNLTISTQLEKQPVFMGSDNDSEESYYDRNIVGVTFHLDSKLFIQSKMNLQKQYGSDFVKKSLKSAWIADEYWILGVNEELRVVIIEKLKHRDTLMTISFYGGVASSEIENYIIRDSKEYVY